jgi:hypothetical protein
MDIFYWGLRTWGSIPWGSTGPITNAWVPPTPVLRRLREEIRRVGVVNDRMSEYSLAVNMQDRIFYKFRGLTKNNPLNPKDLISEE